MDENEEIIAEFIVECQEGLEQLDDAFLILKQDLSASSHIDLIFRVIHSIKGTSNFFGFSQLEEVAHNAETLLDSVRNNKIELQDAMVDTLLEVVDFMREILDAIASNGAEPKMNSKALIKTLAGYLGKSVRKKKKAAAAKVEDEEMSEADLEALFDSVKAAAAVKTKAVELEVQSKSTLVIEPTIRVKVDLLDKLLNTVGELVLIRNQMNDYATAQDDQTFRLTAQNLNQVTSELQDDIMATRMQPISTIWRKFPRVIHDLSKACDKKINLEMDGESTELDKTLIEYLKDPMTHIIRNAVDHGIESPDVRVSNGKPEAGTVNLNAYHQDGQIHLDILDNGAGINREKVLEKAIEKKLVSEGQIGAMSDDEISGLIFHPGFSTAEKITNVSGRGVGMDVVQTNIAKIGGTIEVKSNPGQGSMIKIRLPLTLAIMPTLLVKTAGQKFAIPQASLVELLHLEGKKLEEQVEFYDKVACLHLRGELIPLVHLSDLIEAKSSLLTTVKSKEAINVIVLQCGGKQLGLLVDRVLDTREIVVKPLGALLKSIELFSGATILGDGTLALIVDVLGLAREANVLSESQLTVASPKSDVVEEISNSQEELLQFINKQQGRVALPISKITRIERVSVSQIERLDGRAVIQYGEEVVRVLVYPKTELSTFENLKKDEEIHLVICQNISGKLVGVYLGDMLEIANPESTAEHEIENPYVRSSAVLAGAVSEILDIDKFIQDAA